MCVRETEKESEMGKGREAGARQNCESGTEMTSEPQRDRDRKGVSGGDRPLLSLHFARADGLRERVVC